MNFFFGVTLETAALDAYCGHAAYYNSTVENGVRSAAAAGCCCRGGYYMHVRHVYVFVHHRYHIMITKIV
ncbi:hypothetical protein OAV88_02045 [bacterium]|nr:hypothetical protein [bacterium]